jgi:fructosamine-3-kinase
MDSELKKRIEKLIGSNVVTHTTLSGGDISNAIKVQTNSGYYFIKQNSGHQAHAMFLAEAKGIDLLRQTMTFNIPQIIAIDPHFLILEFVQAGNSTNNYWEQAGISLAKLHKTTSSHFGLDHDNFIGSLPQLNDQHDTWSAFYSDCRLIPQFERAIEGGFFNQSDKTKFEHLIQQLPEILPEEPPSLIHGDLWSGNIFSDENARPILIDPAVCYAHREMDIAMSLLFGGFNQTFYNAYQNEYPLLSDWRERTQLYQLYYLLVHVNLFGRAYVSSCREIINNYQ